MKTCILTIIKNEHQYLDEWIQYHLHLGIDHIFIFEDIDSESHLNITNKYNNVLLQKINNIINTSLLEKLWENKKKYNINPQPTYLQFGLDYIKSNFPQYDWCFVIDNDEFITLQHEATISDALKSYTNYDAIILSWECYGANGIIDKPDYTNKGVIQTYTQKLSGHVPVLSKKALTKTCYNLKKY